MADSKAKGLDKRFLIAPGLWAGAVATSYFMQPADLLKLGHLYSVALNFGMTAFFTIISSPIMLRELPRPQFGRVQGKLFPWYFGLQSVCSLLVASSMHKYSDNKAQKVMAYLSVLCAALQVVIIEPQTNSALKAFTKIRKEEGEDSETKEFKKAKGKFYAWHGVSSLTNLATFVFQTLHIYWLCQSGKLSL